MPFSWSIEHAHAERIGTGGVSAIRNAAPLMAP